MTALFQQACQHKTEEKQSGQQEIPRGKGKEDKKYEIAQAQGLST